MAKWKRWALVFVLVAVLAWVLWPSSPKAQSAKLGTVSDPGDDPNLPIINLSTGKVLT